MPVIAAIAIVLVLSFVAWMMYRRGAPAAATDTSPFGLTECFDERSLVSVPHQKGVRWLTEVFARSAERFPDLTALQVPHTGESLTFAELERRAEEVAEAVAPFLTGPDQVVAVAMTQDNWQVVAAHLGVLKAGGTFMFLDAALPDALISHMLSDARPVVVLTKGVAEFRGLPTLNVLALPEKTSARVPPGWLDDPTQRLAAIFYTSGTTGMPKGVECPHAGYVNLALSYADYFDLLPGMDATSLTSSLGYDGSISEMYSAWVSGCAVVLLTKEQIRSGPDLVPVLREAEVTVLFCPPVLLTTLTETPELDLPYPLCRYIVPAGEAFPSALVDPWTRGRRQIINTYGPTEASTDTSRQSLRPGEPVTIGSPFPNVTYVVLEVGQLHPMPHGEVGELCIGGVHLARGYRNLPEQTAQKFITHPQFGRLYRTGDKCKIDIRTQRVHFLGRIDAQLKVRGHRVEAEAVEHMLETQIGEIEAAVLANQNDSLVAFVVAPSVRDGTGSEVVPAPAPWAARVTDILSAQLPPPSVPTRIFLVRKFVTNPISGKIDRRRLPDLSHLLKNAAPLAKVAVGDARIDPSEILARDCDEVLGICRAVFETPLGPDDGFAESGGHSILIARLAQRLQAAGWVVPLRALLGECNTARKVATRPRRSPHTGGAPAGQVKSDADAAGGDEAAAEVLSIGHFTSRQVLFAVVLYLPMFLAILGVADLVDLRTLGTARLSTFMIAGLLAYLLGLIAPFAALLWVMLLKLVLGGDIHKNDVRPGVYPKWSRMHLRIWRIERMERTVLRALAAMYRSAPLTSFILRQLGATVGHNLQCAQDASFFGPLDLISIEDDVSVSTGAYIHTTRWSGQSLQVGPIRLERGCKIGMRAAVANGVTVGRGTWITPFTPILADVGPHEMWEGAPARLAGRCTELKRTASACQYAQPIWLLEIVNILMQGVLNLWLSVAPTIAISWVALGFVFPGRAVLHGGYFGATPPLEIVWRLALFGFVTNWVSIVVTSTLGCLFIRCTAGTPGLYPSHGLRGALLMYRMNLMNVIQRRWTWTIIGQYLRALAGVRFPRVGASECDLMVNLVPELASADSRAFWCHQAFTNMLDAGAEHLKLRRLELPRNFLCGNNSVAEYGKFPANFLLGVSTPASDIRFRRQMRSRRGEPITVAGNPPVRFASASFESENEALPGFSLFLTRVVLNDLFSIGTLRITEGLVFAISYLGLSRWGLNLVANVLVSFLLTELALILFAAAIKACLVGRQWGADHSTPFWSWKHFAYFFVQDCFFVWCRSSLQFFAGTVLASHVLRLMGCRIGHRTIVIQPLQCSDWNAVQFGNDCVVDGFLQFHTFEDMILRVKRTRIQDRCAVNFGATVMGGVVMEQDTTLVPLALVLKEMNLPTATYEGSPAEPVTAQISVSSGVPHGYPRQR
jgi:non-ribosomal peptide synthetase-like protein